MNEGKKVFDLKMKDNKTGKEFYFSKESIVIEETKTEDNNYIIEKLSEMDCIPFLFTNEEISNAIFNLEEESLLNKIKKLKDSKDWCSEQIELYSKEINSLKLELINKYEEKYINCFVKLKYKTITTDLGMIKKVFFKNNEIMFKIKKIEINTNNKIITSYVNLNFNEFKIIDESEFNKEVSELFVYYLAEDYE